MFRDSLIRTLAAGIILGGLAGCATTDTTTMERDIEKAAAPHFGPFMTHLVKADYHLQSAEGIHNNMTSEPEVYGNKPRFQKAGEKHAKLALEHRQKASDALQRILDERLLHLESMHVTKDVTLTVTNVYFATGSSSLNSKAHGAIKEVAALLKKYPMSSVGIVGFTDTVSSQPYNKGLAKRRADAVFNALVGMGAPRKVFETAGVTIEAVGEAEGPDNTADQENRRVEIRVQPHARPLSN